MRALENPRFRVTVRPTPERAIPFVGGVVAELHDNAIRYLQGGPDVELPPELAIRELPRLDPNDPASLLAFTNQWGPLTAAFGNPAALLPARERRQLLGIEVFDHPRNDLAPLEVVSHHVRALSAVIRHWSWYQWGDDGRIAGAWTSAGFNEPPSLDVAWDWWADYVNAALEPFKLGVLVESVDDDGRQQRRHGRQPEVTAYSAMMLQVLNDVAAGTAWRVCANEPCHRIFARQQGRAERGQHRSTGIRYCTSRCARAQGERERRRARTKVNQP